MLRIYNINIYKLFMHGACVHLEIKDCCLVYKLLGN